MADNHGVVAGQFDDVEGSDDDEKIVVVTVDQFTGLHGSTDKAHFENMEIDENESDDEDFDNWDWQEQHGGSE